MSKFNRGIIDAIGDIGAGKIDIALQIGDSDADIKGTALSRMNRRRGRGEHLFKHDCHTGAALALFQSPDYARNMIEFVAHLERRDSINDPQSHPMQHLCEYLDYYHILADALAQKIAQAGITHAVFFDVPHLVYDTMAYQLARAMGIKIIIVLQSNVPAKFMSLSALDDIGVFPDSAAAPYPIDRDNQPELFYMRGIAQEQTVHGRLSLKAALTILASQLWRDPASLLNLRRTAQTLARARRVSAELPDWRDPFARFFHMRDLAYFEHLLDYEDAKVDLSGDYVYFPLQLEPEMTTNALGGLYADQALAIEHLADMLPDGVRILVKENPKQGGYARGPMFFHRLRRIPAVQFLPSHANTHALTAQARFVATITGTVGWEAIRQGVPALAFGRAWYRDLPGAVRYTPGLRYQDVAGLRWDHATLEARFGALVARMHPGYVNRHYLRHAKDMTAEDNAPIVARQIIGLLDGDLQPTFAS